MDRQDNAIVMQLSPGALLGPYRIERQLGRGGMAEVYSARDTRLGRTVAIKLLRREFAEQRDFRHRFEREGRAIVGARCRCTRIQGHPGTRTW